MKGLEDNNIYTLLDVHQDGLWPGTIVHNSTYNSTEGYWGVPPWIKDKLTGDDRPFPWPFQNIDPWICRYFTEETNNIFGRFYEDINGAADDFAKFWSIVANR